MSAPARWSCVVCVVVGACVGAPATESTSGALVGGIPTFEFPAALYLQGPNGTCTGSLIAPDIVLSAAHCQHEAGGGAFIMSFDMVVDGEVIDEVRTHRRHDGGDSFSHHDIAMLRLAAPLAIEPVILQLEPLPEGFLGTELTVVGLGVVDGTVLNGGGAKRIATMTVDSMIPDYMTGGEAAVSICYGDSGGPAFADIDGVQTQVGITRSHFNDCQGQSQWTRIDTYADEFVIPIIDAWSGPCAFDGNCVESGCRTPDPDCAPCGIDNVCSTGCDTADPDCPLGGLMSAPCSDAEQCESRRCLSDEFDRGNYCSQHCDTEICPFGSSCQDVDGEALCVRDPPAEPLDTGGCSAVRDGSAAGPWLCLVAWLVLARRRRQRGVS